LVVASLLVTMATILRAILELVQVWIVLRLDDLISRASAVSVQLLAFAPLLTGLVTHVYLPG